MRLRRGVLMVLALSIGLAARVRAAEQAPAVARSLEASYLGTHRLRVNRIPGRDWTGTVTIEKEGGALRLAGSLRRGAHHLALSGTVEPETARKFHLDGELRGVPDMAWAGEPPRERTTRGRFTFEATGRRRFWRLYQIDGRECVCNDGCGNDFCYIDIEFLRDAR
jgi:hypothetical protein